MQYFTYICVMLRWYKKLKGLRFGDLVFTQIHLSRRFESRRNPYFSSQINQYVSVSFPNVFSWLVIAIINPGSVLPFTTWSVIREKTSTYTGIRDRVHS